MSKRNEDGTFVPGEIYVLVSGDLDSDNWDCFYVGESINGDQRETQHQYMGSVADERSTDVYRHIKWLNDNNIPWSHQTVMTYGEEGPTDKEDEVLITLTLNGCNLKNEKRGNAHWELVLQVMRENNIASYQDYKAWKTEQNALKDSKKIKEFTLLGPLTKAQRKESAEKRKIAKEKGLLPSRRKKTK